jgi:lysophospholipase L1-like esterase
MKEPTGSRQLTVRNNFAMVFIAYCLLSTTYFSTGISHAVAQDTLFQDTLSFSYKTYGLENDSANVIQNVAHLDEFYEHLYRLKKKGERVVSIVHIGDSHIQADYLTHAVRKNFQRDFGNAGRGLVVPAKVAGSNEAFNIVTSSNITWQAKRCVYPDQPLPIGIGGITINTNEAGARLNVYMNDLWFDYSFNTITLFFQKDVSSFHFSVKDTANHELGFVGPFTREAFDNCSRIILPHSVGAMCVETLKSTPEQVQATIFGLSLENGKSGVIYHAIGVNGAKYAHFNAAMFFATQTAALKPEVFLISLGTNEALDYPYLDRNFYQYMDKFITSLRNHNPEAKFILVTPPEAFRKKMRPNPGILKIREQIIQYAAENGLAFWDMYKATGGEHSAQAWKTTGLMRADGVHFTRDGYEYQGNLLYNALIKGYNQYVSFRHP